MNAASPGAESERIAALRRYDILDTPAEAAFDNLILLASRICGAPYAALAFVDEQRVWIKSSLGLNVTEFPRRGSLASFALDEPKLLRIRDTLADDRHARAQEASFEPRFRFYVAAPVEAAGGERIGVLFVADRLPRQLSSDQQDGLRTLAQQATHELERRLTAAPVSHRAGAGDFDSPGFRQFFQTAPLPIMLLATNGTFLEVNPALCDLIGYSREEFVNLSLTALMDPEDRTVGLESSARSFTGELPRFDMEFRALHKSGRRLWLRMDASQVRDEEGRPLYAICMFQDITARRQAEAEAEAERTHLRQLLERAPVLFWSVNASGQFTASFGPGADRLGLEEPASGEPALATVRQQIVALSKRALGGELAQDEVEWEERTLQLHVEPVRDAAGQVVGAVGAGLDTSAGKRAAEALRQSEERYRVVAETASEGILTLNERGLIQFANPAIGQIFGYAPQELIGEPITRLMPEYLRQAHEAGFRQYLKSGTRHLDWRAVEMPGLHRDGREIALEISFAATQQAGGRLFTGVLRDVTAHKRLEDQLRLAQKMEAVGRLAGGVAHDFNNVITAVNSHLDQLTRELKPRDPAREHVREIGRAIDHAASLTRQLLAFSRRQPLSPQVINLNAIVSNMEKLLRRLIGEDIELRTLLQIGLSNIHADPGQVEQVILNLALNARDAMPNGGLLSIETSEVALDEAYARQHVDATAGNYVLLTVRDNGAGISAEVKARIFEPFFTTKEQGRGTGLGLAMVHGIVAQSGGHIRVESALGQGAEFLVYFPRCAQTAEVLRMPTRTPEAMGGHETILLVEDYLVLRKAVAQLLEKQGYRVLAARNGEEALAMSAEHTGPIDLLITDLVMPKLNGWEIVNELVAVRPQMRVLLISGYSDEASPHPRRPREEEFLQKPFRPETLLQRVRKLLDRPRSRPQGAPA